MFLILASGERPDICRVCGRCDTFFADFPTETTDLYLYKVQCSIITGDGNEKGLEFDFHRAEATTVSSSIPESPGAKKIVWLNGVQPVEN